MLYARRSLNYQVSIRVLRRAALIAVYPLAQAGFYRAARASSPSTSPTPARWGWAPTCGWSNFVHRNTDGPLNPFARVYDRRDVERDFPALRDHPQRAASTLISCSACGAARTAPAGWRAHSGEATGPVAQRMPSSRLATVDAPLGPTNGHRGSCARGAPRPDGGVPVRRASRARTGSLRGTALATLARCRPSSTTSVRSRRPCQIHARPVPG